MKNNHSIKVLHVIASIAPVSGGPSYAIFPMVISQLNIGLNSKLVCTDLYLNKSEQIYKLEKDTIYKSVPLRIFKTLVFGNKKLDQLAISISSLIWIFKNIKDFDLVHIHGLFSFFTSSAMLIARLRKVPYVLRPLGMLNEWSMSQSSFVKKFYLIFLDQQNINKAKYMHYTSRQEFNEASKIAKKTNSFVIPLGLNDDAFKLPKKSTNNNFIKFLFLSRIHPKKNLSSLLNALNILNTEGKLGNWTLSIAGTGDPDYIRKLKDFIREHHLKDKIHWLGFVDGKEKTELFCSHDWFILPSFSENFGISVAESLASSLPVVITSGVALSENLLRYKAGYLTGTDTDSIKKTLLKCTRKPTYEMKSNAYRLANENFNSLLIANKVKYYYDKSIDI